MRRYVYLALALGVVNACSCDEEPGLQGRTPSLAVTVRMAGGEAFAVLPGPQPIVFPLTPVGDESLAQVELANAGDADLVLETPSLAGGAPFELREVLTRPCAGGDASGATVPPGACTSLLVAFVPTQAGAASDELVIRSNDASGELRVPLQAEGAASALVVCHQDACAGPGEELVVDFGSLALGSEASRDVAVRNLGSLPLDLLPYQLDGSPEFGVAPAPEAMELEGHGELDLVATFAPQVGGERTATLTISGEGGAEAAVTVRLVGRGDAPAICVEPFPTLDFGEVVEQTTKTLPVRITSCGSLPLELTDVALLTNGEYALPGGDPATPTTLDPGASLDVEIAFTPPAAASSPYPGRLKIESRATGSETLFVTLTGTGVPPRICDLQPIGAGLDFGQTLAGQSRRADVVFQNLGADSCRVAPGGIAVVNGSGGLFRLVTLPPMPLDVGPLGSATAVFRVGVEYVPADATAPDTATLEVRPDGAATASVALAGTPLDPDDFPCLLTAVPASVQFGLATLGHELEETVVLTNVGTEDCMVTQATITAGQGAFRAASGALPIFGSPVPPGARFEVKVSFRPPAEQPYAGNLRVDYSEGFGGAALAANVPLGGEGRAAQLCVNPPSVDFGNLPPGSTATRSVDLLNCGGVDLQLRGLSLRGGGHPGFVFRGPALPSTLAAGASVRVDVDATATPAGAMFGTLEVMSDDADQPRLPVPLRANSSGCERALTCRPDPVTFGRVDLGTSLVRAFTCQNPGGLDVPIAPSVPAPFEIAAAPSVIRAGQAGAIVVRYTPAAIGPATAVVTLGANACEGGALTVDVSGEGVQQLVPECLQPEQFSPQVLWNWERGTAVPESKQIWASPIVSRLEDTDGDGVLTIDDTPRVVVITFNHRDWDQQGSPAGPVQGILRALDGATGAEIFTASDPALRLNSGVTPAVADLDADGWPEIVAQAYVNIPGTSSIPGGPALNGKFVRGYLIAFDHRGRFKWRSAEWTRGTEDIEDMGAIAIGDVDGDGFGEIAVGDHLFDHGGALRWRGGRGTGSTGHGPMSVLADVDGQPGLELVTGRTVYRNDGSVLWDRPDLSDGNPAVADMDGDGDNEVVVRGMDLVVLNGATGATIAGPLLPPVDPAQGRECDPTGVTPGGEQTDCYPIPSNPALLDLDGNGDREIVLSNRDVLLAYHHTLDEIWRVEISDQTGASGPSGFDFEGDGTVASVYSDEGHVFVHDAAGGEVYRETHQSVTLFETTAIADVDRDGHANLVVISNEPMFGTAGGVKALGNSQRNWVHTRGVWNQNGYVDDLVGELGTPIPYAGPLDGFRTAEPACW